MSRQNFRKAGVRDAPARKKPVKKRKAFKANAAFIGFDVSMSSIAGAAFGWDYVLKKWKGPVTTIQRWTTDDHYFSRLKDAAHADRYVHALIFQLGFSPELDEIHIGVEEPWPYGITRNTESGWLKQQAQVTGAFLGGLIRYGYVDVWEVNSIHWRQLVALDLGITTHYTKWGRGLEGKMRAKEWCEEFKGWKLDLPDLIRTKHGLVEKPDTSRAKPVQPADEYDALAIAEHIKREIRRGLR